MHVIALLFALSGLLIRPVVAAPTPPSTYTTVRVDTREQRLELFLYDGHGQPFHRFDHLAASLAAHGLSLRFAMNAGMFEPDFSPVGLFVADGHELKPLNLADGKGNFYLKPNGVFFIDGDGPRVVESSHYPRVAHDVRLATQSGPLLLEHGAIHPGFDPGSSSRRIRNGVGVDGAFVWFVISDTPVTFHEFARYFRDVLHCTDALYLDGNLSSLYDLARSRDDEREPLGPIIGVVETRQSSAR
ncbi:MAG: phosphodiester glycosidase family protein [Proteobacteria bacterium]|nr:phosphodiester glycosidase family protein [Pseudomonadota bacterium]